MFIGAGLGLIIAFLIILTAVLPFHSMAADHNAELMEKTVLLLENSGPEGRHAAKWFPRHIRAIYASHKLALWAGVLLKLALAAMMILYGVLYRKFRMSGN